MKIIDVQKCASCNEIIASDKLKSVITSSFFTQDFGKDNKFEGWKLNNNVAEICQDCEHNLENLIN